MKIYIYLLLAMSVLTGCSSKESDFLSSMEGRWTQNEESFNLLVVDDKLVMVDHAGDVMLISSAGEFDKNNNSMSVEVIIHTNYAAPDSGRSPAELGKSYMDVAFAVSNHVCRDNEDYQKLVAMLGGLAGIGATDACLYGEGSSKTDIESHILEMENSKKVISSGVKLTMILFNASENPKELTNFGLKNDDGKVIYSSTFVRKLNDSETESLSKYSSLIKTFSANSDKIITRIISDYKSKKNDEKLKADSEKKDEEDAKKRDEEKNLALIKSRIGHYFFTLYRDNEKQQIQEFLNGLQIIHYTTETTSMVCVGPFEDMNQAQEAANRVENESEQVFKVKDMKIRRSETGQCLS